MFTGIVEEMGSVKEIIKNDLSLRLKIGASQIMDDLSVGDSVSVNGACLTVLDPTSSGFSCDVSPETASLTNLGELEVGDQINLERAMRLTDRLSGHLVSGHIEGVGKIAIKQQEENAVILGIEIPPLILKYCIPKGSITLDGVSMTINQLDEKGIEISVIPHTAAVTTLGQKDIGDVVNLESDLIGKYVERLMLGGNVSSPFASEDRA
ncbi:riboflavin synthase [Nitrospira defluvii]|nr:riboflavin synthase [Nitrospira defluvii]